MRSVNIDFYQKEMQMDKKIFALIALLTLTTTGLFGSEAQACSECNPSVGYQLVYDSFPAAFARTFGSIPRALFSRDYSPRVVRC
jgi:hypothetical protein